MAALQSMGAYLRTLKTFQVEAVTTNEDVLEDGQKIQYTGTVNILAQMPDRLRTEVTNDRVERHVPLRRQELHALREAAQLLRDGAGPAHDRRARREAGRRLRHQRAARRPLPLGHARLEHARASRRPWTSARASSLGTTCQQYAFRQDDIDWQIWIQKGDYPLPRKLVITTKTDEARPQLTAVYTWNLAPSFNDAAFTFDPPAGAGKVVLAEIKAAAAATK